MLAGFNGLEVWNFESAGIIKFVPYFVDFVIKAANGFQSKDWWDFFSEVLKKLINSIFKRVASLESDNLVRFYCVSQRFSNINLDRVIDIYGA